MKVAIYSRPFGRSAPWLFGVMWVNGSLYVGLGVVTFVVMPS